MSRSALLAPIALLLVAMVSIQSGASLAKNLFPLVGAEGTTALRLVLGAIILSLVMQPWRAKLDLRKCHALLAYGLALGGMNLMFYMSLQSIPLGIAVALEFTGPLALALFSSRRLLDFVWVILAIAGLWMLLPTGATQSAIDPLGAALALGAGCAGRCTSSSARKPAPSMAATPSPWAPGSPPCWSCPLASGMPARAC